MFADIGLGIIAAIVTSFLFEVDLSSGFVFGGVIFTLLPDIDALTSLLKKKTFLILHEHRQFPHKPLVMILLAVTIAFLFGPHWAFLVGLSLFLHLLHDSIGIGWGVQWLWPFSKDYFSFFYLFQPKNRPTIPGKKFGIYRFKESELVSLEENFGDPNWVKNIYFKFHPYSIAEFLIFLGAVIWLLLIFYK